MTNSITVYQTDEDGAFLHPVLAHELAQSPGAYNVPFGAKLTAPPEVATGEVAVAAGDYWFTVENHREDTLYVVDSGQPYALKTTLIVNAAAVRYTGLGPIPDWLTLDPPVLEEPEAPAEDADPEETEQQ